MVVNPEQYNTLILAVMEIDRKSIAIGNLQAATGIDKEVIVVTGTTAMEVLKTALKEAKVIRVKQVAVLCNSNAVVAQYTHPIRLPLRKPSSLKYSIPKTDWGVGAWSAQDSDVIQPSIEWDVMRLFCDFDKWQVKYLHEDNMKRTKELWGEHYESNRIFR